ncbi:GNAT family N-acetyltransferase [Aestuariivirga sp.]|uniref:GNAT family N-acetyltransferase n=1 Tax=Aestuariivirga sp. TaxID=2650926 RepID=UPI0039E2BD1D
MALEKGYHVLTAGQLANVVTCLEMTAKPALRPAPGGEAFRLERMSGTDTERFRALFSAIGRDLMWFSRLVMPREKLASIIGDANVESYVLMDDAQELGLLELDFREAGVCELSFFGLVPQAIGKGAGRFLMNEAIARAWARPIKRLWVHTCTFDHPGALAFYRRSGFVPYQMMVEVHDDPRLTGHMPKEASANVPLLEV